MEKNVYPQRVLCLVFQVSTVWLSFTVYAHFIALNLLVAEWKSKNLSQNWSLNEQDLCPQAVKAADLECCFILFHVFAFSKCTAFSIP